MCAGPLPVLRAFKSQEQCLQLRHIVPQKQGIHGACDSHQEGDSVPTTCLFNAGRTCGTCPFAAWIRQVARILMTPCTSALYPMAPWSWVCTLQMSHTSCVQALPWTQKLPPGTISQSACLRSTWLIDLLFFLLTGSCLGRIPAYHVSPLYVMPI